MSGFAQVSIDAVRDYWNARPCNIRHSQKPLGTKEYFDEVEARKYFVEPHIPLFAQFERWKGKKVLEVGCGIGTDTMNFARAGAQVTAVDLSEESLGVARQRAELFGLDVNFYQANAEQLASVVPVERYDLVYSFGVIHHTPHPHRVIEQIKRFMDAESTFKIMVYNRLSWKVLWIIMQYGHGAYWKMDELIARYSEAQTGCPVTYSYSKKTIQDLLQGFTVQDAMVDHIFPWHIPDYVEHRYIKEWYWRMLPEPVFRWLERNFGWHLCVTAQLDGKRS